MNNPELQRYVDEAVLRMTPAKAQLFLQAHRRILDSLSFLQEHCPDTWRDRLSDSLEAPCGLLSSLSFLQEHYPDTWRERLLALASPYVVLPPDSSR